MALKILKASQDKLNGRISIDCQIVERANGHVTTGAVETHGIDATQLQSIYGGDVQSFLAATHGGMVERHNARKMAVADVLALQGKEIEF